MQIGRKLYYDLATGNIIQDTGERSGEVVETTQEQDFAAYRSLAERTPETVGVIELEFGAFREDFGRCNGYRVNIETKEVEFSYPDPEQPDKEPVFEPSLSKQLEEVKQENEILQTRLSDVEITLTEILFS